MTYTVTENTRTLAYGPRAGETETSWTVVGPAHTESFTKKARAERFAQLLNEGHDQLAALNLAYNPDWTPDTSGPATEAQIAHVNRLLATADLHDIEGSIPLPDPATLTKADASWWIDRLSR